MYFTQDDFKKIQQYLVDHAIKDTEFDLASAVDDEDLIAIVKKIGENNFENKKITVKDFLDKFGDQLWADNLSEKKEGDAFNLDPQAVHYHEEQILSEKQRWTARENIQALGNDEGVLAECCEYMATATDPTVCTEAVRWTPQLLATKDQTQARDNIKAASQLALDILNQKVDSIISHENVGIGSRPKMKSDTATYRDAQAFMQDQFGDDTYTPLEIDPDGPMVTDAVLRLLNFINDTREYVGPLSDLIDEIQALPEFPGINEDEVSVIDVINNIFKERIGIEPLTTDKIETLVDAINSLKKELGTTENDDTQAHTDDYKTDGKNVLDAINELWKYVWGDETEGSDWPEPIVMDDEIFNP